MYVIPIFILSSFLVAEGRQWQGIILALAAPHIITEGAFAVLVLFTLLSVIWGTLRADLGRGAG